MVAKFLLNCHLLLQIKADKDDEGALVFATDTQVEEPVDSPVPHYRRPRDHSDSRRQNTIITLPVKDAHDSANPLNEHDLSTHACACCSQIRENQALTASGPGYCRNTDADGYKPLDLIRMMQRRKENGADCCLRQNSGMTP